MASYLRTLFGSSNNTSSRSSSKGRSESSRSKSHSRSRSESHSSSQKMPVVYCASYSTASTPSTPSASRNHSPSSLRTPRPSPLRYNTYDSSTISSKKRPTRPLELRSGSVSYQSGDSFVPYPIYTPDLSSHSRTNSNSSLYPSSASGHGHSYASSHHSHHSHRPPMTPRTSSSGSVPRRPALKQTNTWHGGESSSRSHAHVSFVNPKRRLTLHMHPLLAASQFSRAPICYDVSHPPSSHSIVDRSTRSAVPAHTLGQSATDPPTMSRLVLRSDKFPWPIVVDAACSSGTKKTAAKFYLGGSSPNSPALPVSNSDVLHAVHDTLAHRATKEEWDALGHGSHAQRKISRAYDRRCRALGGGWDAGIRRVDWLGDKTRLIGVEVDKDSGTSGVGKLIFGRS